MCELRHIMQTSNFKYIRINNEICNINNDEIKVGLAKINFD